MSQVPEDEIRKAWVNPPHTNVIRYSDVQRCPDKNLTAEHYWPGGPCKHFPQREDQEMPTGLAITADELRAAGIANPTPIGAIPPTDTPSDD